MELKDLITVDKAVRNPDVVQQVVTQLIDIIENGLLTQEMSILPSYEAFAKEFGLTRASGCKIYNRLKDYGHWNEDGGFVIDCKERAMQQLQESIRYAKKQGVTCYEIIRLIADNT